MPSNVAVRPAVDSDFAEIARITQAAYIESGHFDDPQNPYLLRIQDVATRAAEAEIWVAEREGQVIGSVTLAEHGEEWADVALEGELEFRLLAVDPQIQRSGAGRALVTAIVEEARRRRNVHGVALSTGATWVVAQSLYDNLGFDRATERDWMAPGGAPLFVYTKAV